MLTWRMAPRRPHMTIQRSNSGSPCCLAFMILLWTARTWKWDVCKWSIMCDLLWLMSNLQSAWYFVLNPQELRGFFSSRILGYCLSGVIVPNLRCIEVDFGHFSMEHPGRYERMAVNNNDTSATRSHWFIHSFFRDAREVLGRTLRSSMCLHMSRSAQPVLIFPCPEYFFFQKTTLWLALAHLVYSSSWKVMWEGSA